MEFKIDDNLVQDMISQKINQCVDNRVRERLKELDWYKTIDSAVFSAVNRSITVDVVKNIIDNIDKKELISEVSRNLSELLVDKLISED